MKKRGSSLFLALALCLTLLPAAAFANGEPETSTLHTHYLCGNAEACSHVGGHNETDKTTFATAIRQDDNGKVWAGGEPEELPYQCALSKGSYYLATDLVLEAPSNTQIGCIQIMGNVTLCLNGHTITVKANREAFKITKSVDTPSPTLTLTDCQGGGKITHDSSFLGNGVNLSENCNFIMYGGSITSNTTWRSGGVWVQDNSTFTMYGGSITVSGAVQITGNKQGTSASNVYLRSGKTITVGTDHLSSNASIGVTTQDPPANEGIAIATGANLNDKRYFHSDTGENYLFYVTSNETICMTAANAHDHPICGASCQDGSSHTSETWQPIDSAEELTAIQNGGYYYLTDDVTLSNNSVWAPPPDTFLCLNGHTITGVAGKDTINVGSGRSFTLTDCMGSGKITHEGSDAVGCGIKVIGTFTMYSGSIAGNRNSNGGGVLVESGGSFIMYGGSITGNKATGSGGGVFVAAQDGTQGRFVMYGGSITGNNVSGFGSGGVCVYGTMTVSGSVQITGNVNGGSKGNDGIYTGGTASNVCLIGRTTITIDGPLTEVSQIGVTLYSNRVFTSGWSTNMSDKEVSSYFTADDSSSTVALENGELKLKRPHTHSWTYTASGATITAKCNAADCTLADASGGSVTIAAPEADALTYDGSPKAAAVTTSGDWLGASADNIRITYKQGETTLPTAPTDAGTYTAGITVGEGGGL